MLSTLIDIKISLQKEPTCPQIYNCNKDTASKVCYSENTEQGIKTMTVKGCSYGEKCKIDNNMLGTCTSSSLQLPPGLYCNDNSECVSNKCEHNNCIGNKEGEKCKAINYFLSFPKYYNATDCVIDYLDEPHYQLGPPIPEPTSGYTNSLNTLLLFIIVIIFLYGK